MSESRERVGERTAVASVKEGWDHLRENSTWTLPNILGCEGNCQIIGNGKPCTECEGGSFSDVRSLQKPQATPDLSSIS